MSDDHGGARPGAGRPKAGKTTAADLRERLLKAKGDREAALAQLADLQLRTRRGELVATDAVALHWAGFVAAVRGKLLGLPSKLAARVAEPGKVAEAQALAQDIVFEALNELAADGVPRAPGAEPRPKPTPKVKAKVKAPPKRNPPAKHYPGNGSI